MPLAITNFTITGLHNARDYSINIDDNKIVMVGYNGLGKTTVVNMLYLLLSRQWK
jgi:recombinational DNA repair ATPase RecF